ncbi:MAG: DNA recombination protein RmuC [Sphingomonadales bacterium]|nr:DNA recombination protein RmuC [Sphingomonadales bacterium]
MECDVESAGIIVGLLVALLLGVALGWLAGSRPAAEVRRRLAEREAEAKALDERFRAAITDLAGVSERAARADALAEELVVVRVAHGEAVEALRREQDAVVGGLRDAQVRLTGELATLREKTANFDERERLLLQAKEEMRKQFELSGAKVLEDAQKVLLERAQERFAHSEKASKEAVAALLAPVNERLKSYEDQVGALEKARVDAFGQLTGQIELLRSGQEQVRAEAQRLGNSLRNAPKARGRWGEQQLRNVLEQCGLAEHTDFVTEHSIQTEDGRLRPDAIVRIPGQKMLIIDAKVSLNAYQEAFEAQDDAAREAALKMHVGSMKTHIQALGAKSYQSQFEQAPDYVVMFVPGEHFVAAALEQDPELWDFAFRAKVLLATPTNLVAIARTVAMVWQQDKIAREAVEIGRAGAELYDRLATASEHLKGVGAGLDRAVRKYNDFVGSFDRNVLSSARRLRDKGVSIGKREIDEVAVVESTPRYGEGSEVALLGQGEG